MRYAPREGMSALPEVRIINHVIHDGQRYALSVEKQDTPQGPRPILYLRRMGRGSVDSTYRIGDTSNPEVISLQVCVMIAQAILRTDPSARNRCEASRLVASSIARTFPRVNEQDLATAILAQLR